MTQQGAQKQQDVVRLEDIALDTQAQNVSQQEC
jgi:hypothetical protein